MKLLVVTTEPLDADIVRAIVDAGESPDVRVVAPTITESGFRFWMNDTDIALADAQRVVDESLAALAEAEVPADADAPTDDDPSVSVEDALHTFEPDRIVLIRHPESQAGYREDDLVEQIEDATDAPVVVHIARGEPADAAVGALGSPAGETLHDVDLEERG